MESTVAAMRTLCVHACGSVVMNFHSTSYPRKHYKIKLPEWWHLALLPRPCKRCLWGAANTWSHSESYWVYPRFTKYTCVQNQDITYRFCQLYIWSESYMVTRWQLQRKVPQWCNDLVGFCPRAVNVNTELRSTTTHLALFLGPFMSFMQLSYRLMFNWCAVCVNRDACYEESII